MPIVSNILEIPCGENMTHMPIVSNILEIPCGENMACIEYCTVLQCADLYRVTVDSIYKLDYGNFK